MWYSQTLHGRFEVKSSYTQTLWEATSAKANGKKVPQGSVMHHWNR